MRKHQNLSRLSKLSLFKCSLILAICITNFANVIYAQDKSTVKEEGTVCSLKEKIADLAYNGKIEELKSLLDKDKNLVNSKLKNDETLLTIAAYKGDLELARYVISQGIDIKAKNQWDMDGLLNASISGNVEIAKMLIELGADANIRGGGESTPLLFAIRNNHADFVKLLLAKGANINLPDADNLSPIVNASWYQNSDIIKMLIDRGADFNFTTADNSTILHNVSYRGTAELIDFLIKKGANTNAAEQSGYLPLHIAIQNKNTGAISILCKNTADLNRKEINYGNTPLHFAAINGDVVSTKMLVESGANAKITNNQGMSPVDYAVKYGYGELASYFASINVADKNSVEQTKTNIDAVNGNINTDEVKIWYTGQSGWALQFADKVVIMDYWASGQNSSALSLANGHINPKEFQGKAVYVFVSHDHSDHYDTTIYAWGKNIKNIQYIYGFRPEKSEVHQTSGYHGPSYTYIEDNKTGMVDDIKVTTIKSDDTGQGFLLEVNGMTIFHPGDHAQFNSSIAADYKKEIDFIAEKTNRIDVAFLPVTGCPSRWEKDQIVEGFVYVLDKLNPEKVFPMHAYQREYSLNEFAQIAKDRNYKSNFALMQNKGDHLSYAKPTLSKK